jgi:hypothetical protein
MEHTLYPKSVGGLGITNLDAQNICLLSKWLFKLLNEDGTWQQLLRRKYLQNTILAQAIKKPGDSQFWSGLMEVKEFFFPRGKFKVHNGKFWSGLMGGLVAGQWTSEETIPCSVQHCKKEKSNCSYCVKHQPFEHLF